MKTNRDSIEHTYTQKLIHTDTCIQLIPTFKVAECNMNGQRQLRGIQSVLARIVALVVCKPHSWCTEKARLGIGE